jgi:hypothetical protein
MIDQRLGYVAAIALAAAAATGYILAPRDSISLALGMGRTSLPVEDQLKIPARYHSDNGVAIGAGWFQANRCTYGNGMLALKLGDTKLTISPYDVDRIELDWSQTWTQDRSADVILHKTSGCGDRPVVARTLATKAMGTFDNGIILWAANMSKRDVETYVSKLADIRTGAQCYVEQGLRLCDDPTVEDTDGGASFYAFIDDPERKLASGAPWNLRCHAQRGVFNPSKPGPLTNVECQIADISATGYNYMAKVYDSSMMNAYRFTQLNTDMKTRLETLR